MPASFRLRLAAVVVFLGIALGAFGAHGLADRLAETGRLANWETATLYHLLHGLAMFTVALHSGKTGKARGYWCFLAGVVLFSGSLYALALSGMAKLGAVTPFGGVAFLIGWAHWVFHRSESNPTARN